jgi:hypothetical protein
MDKDHGNATAPHDVEGFIDSKTPKECFLAQWKIEGENESETASELAEYRNCRIGWRWTQADLLCLIARLRIRGYIPNGKGWEAIQDCFSVDGKPIDAHSIRQVSHIKDREYEDQKASGIASRSHYPVHNDAAINRIIKALK